MQAAGTFPPVAFVAWKSFVQMQQHLTGDISEGLVGGRRFLVWSLWKLKGLPNLGMEIAVLEILRAKKPELHRFHPESLGPAFHMVLVTPVFATGFWVVHRINRFIAENSDFDPLLDDRTAPLGLWTQIENNLIDAKTTLSQRETKLAVYAWGSARHVFTTQYHPLHRIPLKFQANLLNRGFPDFLFPFRGILWVKLLVFGMPRQGQEFNMGFQSKRLRIQNAFGLKQISIPIEKSLHRGTSGFWQTHMQDCSNHFTI
jgi:hypothetical protein